MFFSSLLLFSGVFSYELILVINIKSFFVYKIFNDFLEIFKNYFEEKNSKLFFVQLLRMYFFCFVFFRPKKTSNYNRNNTELE